MTKNVQYPSLPSSLLLPGRFARMTPRLRAGLRLLAEGQRVDKLGHVLGGQVLVIMRAGLVMDLAHRPVDAGAEAFDLANGEQPVMRRLAHADPEFLFAGVDDRVRTAQPARRRRADL